MQRQQIGNGIGGGGIVTTVNGGSSDGINNAGGNTAGIGSNGSTGSTGSGGRGGGSFNGGSGVSSTYYQNANTQAAPAWAFQLLPSLYNHYQKVLENPARIAATNRLPP